MTLTTLARSPFRKPSNRLDDQERKMTNEKESETMGEEWVSRNKEGNVIIIGIIVPLIILVNCYLIIIIIL